MQSREPKRAIWLIVLSVVGTTFGAGVASAGDVEVSAAIEQLLQVGWDDSQQAKSATRRIVAAVSPNDAANPRFCYTLAVVQIKQRRYTSAAGQIDAALESDERNLSAWRAKVWLALMQRRYGVALVALDRIAQLLAGPMPPADQAKFRETAGFVGRMFGYLDGPAAGQYSDVVRDRYRRRVAGRLGPRWAGPFNNGRQQIQRHFQLLATRRDAASRLAQAELARRQQPQSEQLRAQQAAATAEETRLSARREQLRSDAVAAVQEIRKQQGKTAATLETLDKQLAVVRRELALLDRQAFALQRAVSREADPVLRSQQQRELAKLAQLAVRYQADLVVAERHRAKVLAEQSSLQKKLETTQDQFHPQFEDLDAQQADLRRRQQLLASQERHLPVSTAVETPHVRALSAQAAALTTYEPFPLEAERQELRAWLKQAPR